MRKQLVWLALASISIAGCGQHGYTPGKPTEKFNVSQADKPPEMHPSLEQLFTTHDDYELIMGVCGAIDHKRKKGNLARTDIPIEQQTVRQIVFAQGIIGNGGFRYFEEVNGDEDALIQALKRIGAHEAVKAVEFYDEEAFWDLGNAMDRSLAAYIRSHKEAFTDLQPLPEDMPREELPAPKVDSSSRDVAAWLLGTGSAVVLRTTEDDRNYLHDIEDLPRGEVTILEIQLNESRNDVDELLQVLSRLNAVDAVKLLKIGGAYISPAGLSHLHEWKRLPALSLSRTYITDEELRPIGELSQLKELNLWGTRITDEGVPFLSGLSELQTLSLGETEVSNECLPALVKLSNLRNLDLRETKIDDNGLPLLSTLHELRKLDLSGCEISDDGMAAVAKLTKLRQLSFKDTDVTDRGLVHLKNLDRLEHLALPSSITDAGLDHILHLKEIRYLYIYHSQITVQGILRLSPLKKLETLEYYDDEAVDKLRRALPNLR